MAWLMVVTAGLLEMVWSYSAKQADGFSKLGWSAVTLGTSLASFLLLTFSLRTLPLGTAYVVWTGLGAVGSFAVGIVLLHESASAWRLVSGALILAGVIGMRLTSTE